MARQRFLNPTFHFCICCTLVKNFPWLKLVQTSLLSFSTVSDYDSVYKTKESKKTQVWNIFNQEIILTTVYNLL